MKILVRYTQEMEFPDIEDYELLVRLIRERTAEGMPCDLTGDGTQYRGIRGRRRMLEIEKVTS